MPVSLRSAPGRGSSLSAVPDCLPRGAAWCDARRSCPPPRRGQSPRRCCRRPPPAIFGRAAAGGSLAFTQHRGELAAFDLAQFDMIKYIHLGLLSEPQVHRKARPVSGLHLRLFAHVPTTACRGRHATPLPRQPTLGSSDGPHHRASWLYPTPTRRRPKHRATCCPGKSAHPKMTENQPVKTSVHRFSRLGLWCRLATTKTRAGPSLCQVGHLDRQHTRVFLVGDYAPRKDINEILSRGGSR